ncbi:TonB-dependent receptor [Marinimicrobium locisalis]|uniref:TonB-dependent receptor n=1 Tax=Marinimicrobium locisalis TaxID=546022 RepID=UPI0032215A35
MSLKKSTLKPIAAAVALASAGAHAQEADLIEEVVVTGIRASLEQAMDIKRNSTGVVDAISAEDIGKFPDTNLAESLQRITGVSISRSGGEGNSVTVRGLGPQFNAVTLNGRSMPAPATGRGFRFDTIAAEMVSGVSVYKTASSTVPSGGIGATIDVKTARPLDIGDKLTGSVKMLSDVDAGSTTPAVSGLFSKATDTFGVLAAVSYQEREAENDWVEVRRWNNREEIVRERGWGSPRLEYDNGDAPANYYPTQSALGRQTQKRERLNASITGQFAPTDSLTATLDANYSDLKITGRDVESAYWFGHQYDTPASVNGSETLTSMGANDVGLDMFMRAPESRFIIEQLGLNVEWRVTDEQILSFDFATSSAERNPDQERNVNASDVQAVPIDLMFDTRNGVATHYFDGSQLSLSDAKLHQQDVYSNNNLDELDQLRFDYAFEGDTATLKAGMMYTDQTKLVKSYNNNKGTDGSESGRAYSFRGYFPLVGTFEQDWDGEGTEYETETYNGLFETVAEAEAAGYGIDTINHDFVGSTSFITFDPYAAHTWEETLSQMPGYIGLDLVEQIDWYEINEETVAAYVELTSYTELAGRPLTLVAGSRIENTSVESTSLESTLTGLEIVPSDSNVAENMSRTFSENTPYTDGGDYDVFLPNMSINFEATDEVVLRFAASRTITRPELGNMRSSRSFGDIRDDGEPGLGSAGNPELKPYMSDNVDLSAEWYFDDTSYASVGLFHKVVDNFIVEYGETETIEGVTNPATGEDVVYNFTRPQNQDTKKVRGAEFALQYAFSDSGFGMIANATVVDTDTPFETDQFDSSAFIGFSDSANLIGFYDKNGIQARIAYNWRDSFVESFGHTYETTTGEPTQVDSYGQIDLSASYDLTDSLTVFIEGINVTSEETHKYSRFKDQFLYAQTNSARYALGIRASF